MASLDKTQLAFPDTETLTSYLNADPNVAPGIKKAGYIPIIAKAFAGQKLSGSAFDAKMKDTLDKMHLNEASYGCFYHLFVERLCLYNKVKAVFTLRSAEGQFPPDIEGVD